MGLTEAELGRLSVKAARSGSLDAWPARVDSSGVHFIDGVGAGRWLVTGTVGAGERRISREVVVVDNSVEIDLEFERHFDLRGVVRLDGEPLASTRVILGEPLQWARIRQTWTLHDGSFRFTDVENGDYQLGVGASLHDVSVDGSEHIVVDLGSGEVRGVVRSSETLLPWAGAEVSMWPALLTESEARQLGVRLSTFADNAGEFAFHRVPEGSWMAAMPEYPSTQSPVSVAPGSLTAVQLQSP